jgi:carboxyl-terminal processing protease
MSSRRRSLMLAVSGIPALALAFLLGAWTESRTLLLGASPPPNTRNEFSLMTEAWNTIQDNYVDRSVLQPDRLAYGAIAGMVDSLGDTGHSTFLSPEMLKEEEDFTQGQFEGVGLEVQAKNGQVVIVAPIDGSPAQKAGIRSGGIILNVDGQDVRGLPLVQVAEKIQGPAGTRVTLTIEDPQTGQTQEFTLERAKIEIPNVTWHTLPGTNIAHLRIAGFSQGVTQGLRQALGEIQAQGNTRLILDLRNDPGGLLSEAIGVASQFLGSGVVLEERNAKGEVTQVAVEPGGVATDISMVVLINGGTASAAEIVAGALQDAHRAAIIGETTFGTGTVLSQFPLPDGSALLLATEEWLTPSGKSIWHNGITPDIQVTLPASATPLVPAAEEGMSQAAIAASGDTQLLRGMRELNGGGGG